MDRSAIHRLATLPQTYSVEIEIMKKSSQGQSRSKNIDEKFRSEHFEIVKDFRVSGIGDWDSNFSNEIFVVDS